MTFTNHLSAPWTNKSVDLLLHERWEVPSFLFDIIKIRFKGIPDDSVTLLREGHFCAYLTTDKTITRSLDDAPVNGGITFDCYNPDGSRTIGFDFAHGWNLTNAPSVEFVKENLGNLQQYLFGEEEQA